MNILITGGAGFIGSRLAKTLVSCGHQVTILDNLSEQVHGARPRFPEELSDVAKCVLADVRDHDALKPLIRGKTGIVHLAAETGTGQSMYAVRQYADVNLMGTATLFDILINNRSAELQKLIVASSRAIYGEGKYLCDAHDVVYPRARTVEALSAARFEPECPRCGSPVQVLATSEDSPFAPSSFYGLSKQVQEQMTLMFGATLSLDAIALRFQNVYGPGQSLLNPYTGLLAIFSNLIRQQKAINIFEDGLESRDFVYIDDAVDATIACLSPKVRGCLALNVGSGVRTTVLEVASAIQTFYSSGVPINVTGSYRLGDIRHNVADISRIQSIAGYAPTYEFADGLAEFLKWAEASPASESGFERSIVELKQRGLFGGTA